MPAPGPSISSAPSLANSRRTLLAGLWPLLVLSLLAGRVLAQELRWRIPHRGAHVYERSTEQFDVAPPPTSPRRVICIAGGRSTEPHRFRMLAGTVAERPAGFERPDFDDGAWPVAAGEFAGEAGARAGQRTTWRSESLCLRTTFDVGRRLPRALAFTLAHDDGVRIWLNGVQVVADDGYGRDRLHVLVGDALAPLRPGSNVLAVACTNIGGAQHLDVELAAFPSLPDQLRSQSQLRAVLQAELDAMARVRRELFGDYRPPAILLQGELTASGTGLRLPPADLRDLAAFLAMDLRTGANGGAVDLEVHRLFRLGDLRLRGRASAIDADGWQTLEVTVQSPAEPALLTDSRRHLLRFVAPHVLYHFDGKLLVRRRCARDGAEVVVEQFDSELSGALTQGKNWRERAAEVHQREHCRLVATRDNQDAAFRTMVADAITRGTTRLREQLRDLRADGLAAQPKDAADSYHTGRLALGLLALVKGGAAPDDPVVRDGFAELRRRRPFDTYSVANTMFALEALHEPADEVGQLRTGVLDRVRPRELPPDDLAWMRTLCARLLENHDTRVDPESLLRFHYTQGPGFDHSTNQYGLLGLHTARACGVELPDSTFVAAAQHLLAAQQDEGRKVELQRIDFRTLARGETSAATTTAARATAFANGWGYKEPRNDGELAPVWGSMTCAGIVGLTICEAAIRDLPVAKRDPRLLQEIVRARDDGFAWLAEHMSPRFHPGAIQHRQQWHYYWLYSLERAALLSSTALIQDRDWYFEGAMVLAAAQLADGHWPPEVLWEQAIERNAMAILFLKQSTRPATTGR